MKLTHVLGVEDGHNAVILPTLLDGSDLHLL